MKERTFRYPSSQVLLRISSRSAASRTQQLDVGGSWMWETDPTAVRRILIFDFRGFWSKPDAGVDAGVGADAAWRNRQSFAGWTIVRMFRYCRVSPASREGNSATCEPPTCRIVVAISLVSGRGQNHPRWTSLSRASCWSHWSPLRTVSAQYLD